MKKKFNLNAAALMCTMVLSSLNVYSAENVSTFEELKNAITNNESPVDIQDSSTENAIKFSELIKYENKDVTITGKENSSFTPDEGYNKGAFEARGTGSLTLKDVKFDNFGEKSESGVDYVIFSEGDVNIGPGVTFGPNIKTGNYRGSGNRGTVYMQNVNDVTKKLTLESSEGKDVVFNTQNAPGGPQTVDVFMTGKNINMDIKGEGGKVEIGNGIANGQSSINITITHSGKNNFILGGNNSAFVGKYTQSAEGTTTFKGTKYFAGESDIQAGYFNWQAANDTTRGKLSFGSDTHLTVGDGSIASYLTLSGSKDTIAQTINMVVQQSSELTLDGFNARNVLTLSNKIDGQGTLKLTNDNITFNGENSGLASGLTLETDSSKLILSNMSNDTTTLTKIVSAENENKVNNTIIELENYNGTDSQGLNVDGKKVTELHFKNNNTYTLDAGKTLKVSTAVDGDKSGVITNELGAVTVIKGDVIIESTSGVDNSLVNDTGATLTIQDGSNGLTNKGNINNKGTLNLKSNSNENSGTITNTGSIIIEKSFDNKNTLTSTGTGSLSATTLVNSGTIDMTKSTGEFTSDSVTNSKQIKGVNAKFGTYSGSDEENSKLELLGTLTVDGTETAIQNSGTISANSIDVTQGNVENSGTITSDGKMNVAGKLTNTGEVSMQGGELHEIESTSGSITNTGELKFLDTVSGSNSTITNNGGNITLSGNASTYMGTFTQTAGETTAVNDTLFGGVKNIQGGTLSASGSNLYNGVVDISGDAEFNYTLTGTEGSITEDLLQFTEEGGSANFTGNGTDTVFTLADDIKGEDLGTVTFKDTGLKLSKGTDNGNYNYNDFIIDNSTLKLGEKDSNSIDNYTFTKFTAKNDSKIDFDVQFGEGDQLITDSLTVGAGSSGTLNLGNIFISDESNVENGREYQTKFGQGVLRGDGTGGIGGLRLSGSKNNVQGATTAFVYDISVNDGGRGVKASVTGIADENSLYKMDSKVSKDRFFQFSTNDKKEYNIGQSLQNTLDGTFTVQGKNQDRTQSVLSGKLQEEGIVTENKGSFFNIVEKGEPADKTTGNVELTVKNLTVKDANSTDRGGSVLSNNSSNSRVVLDNLLITDNSSENEQGGAIYNNGGENTEAAVFTKGLWVENTQFSRNSAGTDGNGKGGALYNDTKGVTYLKDVIVDAAVDSAKNDIYNAGYLQTESNQGKTNQFNSLYTNAENAKSYFAGSNKFSDLVNLSEVEDGVVFVFDNEITNKFDNKGNAKNTGDLEFSGTSDFANNGSFTNTGLGSVTIDENATVTGEADGTITNQGIVDLFGKAGGYKGKYTQDSENAETTVVDLGTFFAGESTVSAGVLNWGTKNDLAEGAKLVINSVNDEEGTIFNIGNEEHEGEITFKSGSSISSDVITNISSNGKLNVAGGDVQLSSKSSWNGEVDLTDGNLTLDGINNYHGEGKKSGTLKADAGNLTLKEGTRLVIEDKSYIKKDVVAKIQKNADVVLKEGEITLDNEDTWNGAVILDQTSKGILTFSGYDGTSKGMGVLKADAGTINIVKDETTGLGSNITFGGNDGNKNGIGKSVKTTIDSDSAVTLLKDGYLYLNDDDSDSADTWSGTVNLNGGILNYGMSKAENVGTLNATEGKLNLLSGSVLNIKKPSDVEDKVAVDIQKGSTVNIHEGAIFTIDSESEETKDTWNGLVKNDGGNFNIEKIDNTKGNGGGFQQTSGTSTFKDESNIYISDTNSYIKGGDVVLEGKSKLSFGSGIQDLNVDNLKMADNTQLGILNGEINTAYAKNVDVSGKTNFTVDLNPRNKQGDKYNFGSITGTDATLNVSEFNFLGDAPIDRNIDFTLFTGDKSGVEFDATEDLRFTPIGYYGLKSIGEGNYRAFLDHYNPQVFRGQVATMAMYTSQLLVDDMLTNHFIIHNDRLIDNAKLANKYAAASAIFNPYQKTYKDGELWSKSYVSFNKMDLTNGLSVKNNIYGVLMGADLPSVTLKNNWEFIPTGYIGYNGGHQHFDGVSMYQNGGQLGFMGTFIKDKFIGSVTAYGGGYTNDMSVAGFEDNAGNWFAGTAVKTAYNYSPFKDFTVQPNILVAYNLFGKQNWGTDFGIMSMNSGMLNGINVAPGLNLILQKRTWSLYGSASYMYFANDKIDGRAGNVDLPNVRMDHGYIQYGIGGTKVWNDKLTAYGQVNIRNAGINGIGFQAGINYLLNTLAFSKDEKKVKKEISNRTKPSVNAVYDDTHNTYIKKEVKRVEIK